MNPPPPSPKELAASIMAEYSTIRATLKAALAPYEAQVAQINAAISAVATPHQEKLDELKKRAEALGLSEALGVFGEDTTTFASNGLQLKLSEAEAVKCDDEETTIKRLLKEAGKGHLIIREDDGLSDGDRIAAGACVRIKLELNKAAIQLMYPGHEAWFNQRGIFMEERKSVSLGDLPKPRVSKPKAAKKKAVTPDAEPIQEAA